MTGSAVAQIAGELPIQHDRRRGKRFITIFRVGKITRSTGDELCMLRNMSEGGAMANVASLFHVGEHLTLNLRLEERVEAEVVWVRDGVIGLAFTKPVDLAALLATSAPAGPRPRAPRLCVAAQGKLHVDHEVYRIVTTDVSQSGAKLFVGVPLPCSARVGLWIDGLPQQTGIVRWSSNGMIGVSFNQVIKIWDLTQWARTQHSQTDPFMPPSASSAQLNAAS